MSSTDSKDHIQEELDKAVRQINAILRLMHKGAMRHDQARTELNALEHGSTTSEITKCVQQALKAIDINERSARDAAGKDK